MKVILVEVIPELHTLTMELVPPLGLGYLASSLEAKGHKVSIIEGIRYGNSIKRALQLIIAGSPDVIGFTGTSHARFRAIELIKLTKSATGAFIIAGGAHFNATAREALENVKEIDVVVKGEGEQVMSELIDAYSKKSGFGNIKGIFFRDGGSIIENVDQEALEDIDDIRWPAYHLFSLQEYKCRLEGTNMPMIGVISSRGCPNNCIFCANRVLRKGPLRLRSPKDFVDELEFLKTNYGYRAFNFWDDTLTMSRPHVEHICEEILRRDLNINWFARARVNTVDRAILKLMKDSGCTAIAYGVESGSNKTLATINKGITVQQSDEAVGISSELGFIVSAYFIVSLPKETLDDIDATARLIKKFKSLHNVNCYYCFAIIYPGTDLEKYSKNENLLSGEFSWYKPCYFEKNKIVGNDPLLPCYEGTLLKLEEIKAKMLKSDSLISNLNKAVQRVSKINSFSEIKRMMHLSFRYISRKK